MPLSSAFSVSQVIGQPRVLILSDDSTGSDVAITSRRIYLMKADSTFLVPEGTETEYIEFPLGANTINLDVLDKDYALNVTVQHINSAGVALYTSSELMLFTLHLEQFYYDLTQTQTGTPRIVEDTRYYDSKIRLRCALDEAANAISIGEDIYSAQAALNRGQFLVDHQTLYF
jgi:hypothetical protein